MPGDMYLALIPTNPDKDLVHAFRSKRRLDELAHGNSSHEAAETSNFSFFQLRLMFHNTNRVEGHLSNNTPTLTFNTMKTRLSHCFIRC